MATWLLAQYFPGLGEHYAMNRYYEQAITMYEKWLRYAVPFEQPLLWQKVRNKKYWIDITRNPVEIITYIFE